MIESGVALDCDVMGDHVDAWLEEVGEGSHRALDAIYHVTAGALLGLAMHLLADPQDAEEVLQEAFVAAWSKASVFDRRQATAMTWLAIQVRRRAIDRLRASRPRIARADIEVVQALTDPAPPLVADSDLASKRVRLDSCMRLLDPGARALIRTAFFNGATYEELAKRCGSPVISIKNWIRPGLLELTPHLEIKDAACLLDEPSQAIPDYDVQAGEYVLGVLDARARRHMQARIVQDRRFARAVEAWDNLFSPWLLRPLPITPSPQVWLRLRARLGWPKQASAQKFWQRAAAFLQI